MANFPILLPRLAGTGAEPMAVSVGDFIGFPRNGVYTRVRVASWANDGENAHILTRTKSGKEYYFEGRQLSRLVLLYTAAEFEAERNKPPRQHCPRAEFDAWYTKQGGHFETADVAYRCHVAGWDLLGDTFAQACLEHTGLLPFSARTTGGDERRAMPLPAASERRPAPQRPEYKVMGKPLPDDGE